MWMLTLSAAFAQQTGGNNLLDVTVGEHVDGSTPTDSLTTDSLVADTLALDTIAEPAGPPRCHPEEPSVSDHADRTSGI